MLRTDQQSNAPLSSAHTQLYLAHLWKTFSPKKMNPELQHQYIHVVMHKDLPVRHRKSRVPCLHRVAARRSCTDWIALQVYPSIIVIQNIFRLMKQTANKKYLEMFHGRILCLNINPFRIGALTGAHLLAGGSSQEIVGVALRASVHELLAAAGVRVEEIPN